MLWHNSVIECAAQNRYGAVSELGPRDNKSITGPGIYQLKERPSGIYQLGEISQKPIQQTQPTAQYGKSHCRCIPSNSKELKKKTLPHLTDFFFGFCLRAAFWGIFFSSQIPALSPKVTTGCDRAFHSCPPPLPPHSTHLPPDIGLHGQQLLGHWQHRVQCHHGRDHEQHGCCNQGPSAITPQCHTQSFHNSCNYAPPTISLQKRTTLFLELENTRSDTYLVSILKRGYRLFFSYASSSTL